MKKESAGEKSAKDVYEELSTKGEYKVVHIDIAVIKTIIDIAIDDEKYLNYLLEQKTRNFRIIYRDYYTILRELCDALIRLNGIKISNHQGCFAYICTKFPELKLEWNLLEKIRKTRNLNIYEGKDILEQDWKEIEEKLKLYISIIKGEANQRLKNVKNKTR